jgi:pimeloyl-ACP methyl ester carboxylesterase
VGHSYGGMVVTAVAEEAHERLSQLIYLDAFLPDARKALSDYAPVPQTRADRWRVPPGPPSGWGVTDAVDVEWMRTRVGDQPLKTFTQAVQRSVPPLSAERQAYIQCTKAPFFLEAGRARGNEVLDIVS